MIQTANLGYPRLGQGRAWKRALERFWKGALNETALHETLKTLRTEHLQKQAALGVEWVPVGDFTYYDHVLDLAVDFGLIPERFYTLLDHQPLTAGEGLPLSVYYAIARGHESLPASEMTKWFNTNYHYIVPEIGDDPKPLLLRNRLLEAYEEAKALGIKARPVILGPYTLVSLAKGYSLDRFSHIVRRLIPVYETIFAQLEAAGAEWIQIDEPQLVTDVPTDHLSLLKEIYTTLKAPRKTLKLMLQTYFESLSHYETIVQLPVDGIGLDFVHGQRENEMNVARYGFPQDKVLGVGLINGRNVWRADLMAKYMFLKRLSAHVPFERMILSPSSSLLHVPISLEPEDALEPALKDVLAFADEKLKELALLAHADDPDAMMLQTYQHATEVRERFLATHPFPAPESIDPAMYERAKPFEERKNIQQEHLQLPLLPTTTIGSFPQTKDVRQARAKWRKGDMSDAEYEAFIKEKIAEWIRIQEELGLDVLVHGEFERTDMVEYFGEKLGGFAFTKEGWVQSYGSRAVKPPIIYDKIEYHEPLTLKETVFAQSLTKKPVKGMLTGPVTILHWSFPRDDVAPEAIAFSIADALRQEVAALEGAGIRVVQVDEPAFREGLPLKQEKWQHYLDWAVRAFRLTTAVAKPETQVHTHMCYSEFGDIIDAIKALDADVISIETSRSHGELISAFEENTYDKEIGLGVYDIHSPRVPDRDEIKQLAERALKVLPKEHFWINPDCGLKTRDIPETIASLKLMVDVAKELRNRLNS